MSVHTKKNDVRREAIPTTRDDNSNRLRNYEQLPCLMIVCNPASATYAERSTKENGMPTQYSSTTNSNNNNINSSIESVVGLAASFCTSSSSRIEFQGHERLD